MCPKGFLFIRKFLVKKLLVWPDWPYLYTIKQHFKNIKIMTKQEFIKVVLIEKLGFVQDSKQAYQLNKEDSFIDIGVVVDHGDSLTVSFHNASSGKNTRIGLLLKGNIDSNIKRFIERFNDKWPILKAYNADVLKKQNNKSDYSKWFKTLPSNVIEDAYYYSKELAETSHKIVFNEQWSDDLSQICKLFNELGFMVDVNRETKQVSFKHIPAFIERFLKGTSFQLTSDEKSAVQFREKYTTVVEKIELIQKLVLDVELRLFVF